MLFLLFNLGKDRYALETAQVVEVLPVVSMKSIPGAARGVAGVFNYHGQPVPVVDLAWMALGTASPLHMSTRIILVRYPDEKEMHLLGLLATQATGLLRRLVADFSDAGVEADETPYLGPVTSVDEKFVQWVKVERLLSPDVRDQLFHQALEGV